MAIPGEENGNPLQYSCLENSRAWQASIYGSQSQTGLKWLTTHTHGRYTVI